MINYPMQYEMEQQIVDLIAEIEALKREKDHYIKEWSDVCDENQGLRNDLKAMQDYKDHYHLREWSDLCDENQLLLNDLAASQAREKVRIEALEALSRSALMDRLVRVGLEAAINQPSDDTALKAALADERERCLEIIRDLENASDPDDFALDALRSAEIEISALGDE